MTLRKESMRRLALLAKRITRSVLLEKCLHVPDTVRIADVDSNRCGTADGIYRCRNLHRRLCGTREQNNETDDEYENDEEHEEAHIESRLAQGNACGAKQNARVFP